MRLNRFTFSDALREKKAQDEKWLVFFVALFILCGCMLAASFMAGAK